MFPSVIPLYGTDCSRVTHPSAARMFSVQALRTSPLDLHVLSTPPAFVLSQDQTLMFNPSQVASRPAGSPKPAKRSASLLSTLSESDCSCGSHPPSFDVRRSPFLPSLYRFQGSLAALPLAPRLSARRPRFKRRMLLYQFPPPLSSTFFQAYFPPLLPQYMPVYAHFYHYILRFLTCFTPS